MAFDVVDFDLSLPLLEKCIDALEVVNRYLKKHDLKLVKKEGAMSVIEWAEAIKKFETSLH